MMDNCLTCSPDSMSVILDILCHVVVDYMGNSFNVNTTTSNIRSNKDV